MLSPNILSRGRRMANGTIASAPFMPVLLQSGAANAATSATATVSVVTAGNTTMGSVIVVVAGWEQATNQATCTDSLGTVYTKVTQFTGASTTAVMFVGKTTSAGANTITVASTAAQFLQAAYAEFTGLNGVAQNFTTFSTAGTQPYTTTIVPYGMIIGVHKAFAGSTTYTVTQPYVLLRQLNGMDAICLYAFLSPNFGVSTSVITTTTNNNTTNITASIF